MEETKQINILNSDTINVGHDQGTSCEVALTAVHSTDEHIVEASCQQHPAGWPWSLLSVPVETIPACQVERWQYPTRLKNILFQPSYQSLVLGLLFMVASCTFHVSDANIGGTRHNLIWYQGMSAGCWISRKELLTYVQSKYTSKSLTSGGSCGMTGLRCSIPCSTSFNGTI